MGVFVWWLSAFSVLLLCQADRSRLANSHKVQNSTGIIASTDGAIGVQSAKRETFSILVISYNFGEGEEAVNAAYRHDAVRAIQDQIRDARDPDIVMLAAQEVNQGADAAAPLNNAINALGYTWVGTSRIAGCTKCKVFKASIEVNTAVVVAVRTEMLTSLESAAVQTCNPDLLEKCQIAGGSNKDRPTKQFEVLAKLGVKATKGFGVAHLTYKGKTLALTSVHLDTGEFMNNLQEISNSVKLKDDSLVIIAGDFNNRISGAANEQVCPDSRFDEAAYVQMMCDDKEPELMEKLQITAMTNTLKAGMEGREVAFVPPNKKGNCTQPTYKYSTSKKGELDKGKDKGACSKKGSIGVLDHVAVCYKDVGVAIPAQANFRLVDGSDHAMVAAVVTVDV